MEGTSARAAVPLKSNREFIVLSTKEDVDRLTKETPLQRTFNNYRGWEILAFATILVTLIVLTVILQKYHGKAGGQDGIPFPCKEHIAGFHPRHVKNKVYSWKLGIDGYT
jgi:hypothetical protein